MSVPEFIRFEMYFRVLGILVGLSLVVPSSPSQSTHCYFNQLCTCKLQSGTGFNYSTTISTSGAIQSLLQAPVDIRDISCLGVPFGNIPDIPVPYLTHIDIVDAGLEVLESGQIKSATVESLRFMNNKIVIIDDNLFGSISTTLRSLDLSYNQLTELPINSLSRTKSLDWLNLHGNQIVTLADSYYLNFRNTLTTLFLGENQIISLPDDFFSSFKRLLWLNLDNNHIREIPRLSLARTIHTLSLSNNQIRTFPLEAIEALASLTWFTIRGNYIETIPEKSFGYKKRMDKLDLGENFISSIPTNMFNNTLSVNDLNLDYNYIEKLQEDVFKSVTPRRVYLGMNRITTIDKNAFSGVEDTLELLDMERNKLQNISSAFDKLKNLRYLYLSNNNISEIRVDSFASFSESLRALSLSGNRISIFPRDSLRLCTKLSHLNIGYNDITHIVPQDFLGWAGSIDTLILRNNRLTKLEAHTFKGCPKLRELSLSFNNLESMDDLSFKDIGGSLESLEISFGLLMRIFPESALKPLQKLLWLSLDNNEIEEISETSLYNLGELQYLNLEANKLKKIPANLLHKNVHKNLRDVRLSFNKLRVLRTGQFASLDKLQTIVLTGNLLKDIETGAFRNLPNLVSLILSHNKLSVINRRSFSDLTHLQKLELQYNSLNDFSLSVFDNCTQHPDSPMFLNLSHNVLRHLLPSDNGATLNPPLVQLLDLSFNFISRIPDLFLNSLSLNLRSLDLSHNHLTDIDDTSLQQLSNLQILRIHNNKILNMQKSALTGLTNIQILDFSNNQLESLQFGQFAALANLRIVHLANNRLRSLPRDSFQGTKLETIDLSHNEFQVMPNSALAEVSETVRYLNLSNNHIQHLDSTMFSSTLKLLSLSLAHNRLTILPDNIFMGLSSLLTLDLSHNPIRANFKELFHYTQRLKVLRLSHTALQTLPSLPLPGLLTLDLSHNLLSNLDSISLESLNQLRQLQLSHNKLTNLPSHCWRFIPYLKTLDISFNPIRVLTKESFYGLHRLQDLSVQDLPDLKRFDADSLTQLTYLSNLYIQSWPEIEKFKFRLGSVISGLASLKSLKAKILEPSHILTDQILGAFGPKLKEIEITGPLKAVTLDAFEGVENNYELLLAIRNTNIDSLPEGFHKMFQNIVHFSLDIRDNKFESIPPAILYGNKTHWEHTGTKALQGGMALQGNSWSCSCENVWLGRWLRRWMREALQLHTSVVERGQTIRAVVRTITCKNNDGSERPLVELDSETPCQLQQGVSGSWLAEPFNLNVILLITSLVIAR